MSEHRFKFGSGEKVVAHFEGEVVERRSNLDKPDSYVIRFTSRGGREHHRTFFAHELSHLTPPGGAAASANAANDNVVQLQVAA